MTTNQIKTFIQAGNSTFTLYSNTIDIRYTYKVKLNKDNRYIVKVLYGQDNIEDYRYIGLFYNDSLLLKSECNTQDLRCKMFRAFLKLLRTEETLPKSCEFYPSNNCGHCGRLLTTPESIIRGIGPECWKYINGGN